MSLNTLPGIVRIEMISCEHLPPHVMLRSICGDTVVLGLPSEEIPFFGTPMLKWDGSKENGTRVERSTLEFSTCAVIPEGKRLAFVVTVASGKQYLIGAREPNYPEITFSESTGAPDGEAAIRRYKISHVAQKSVLKCLL